MSLFRKHRGIPPEAVAARVQALVDRKHARDEHHEAKQQAVSLRAIREKNHIRESIFGGRD